jgi:hypothetical protein
LQITQDIFLKHTLRAGKVSIAPEVLPSRCDIPLPNICFPRPLFLTNLVKLQGLGGILVRKIEGDYNNVVGFPAASFFKLLDLLVDEDPDFLDL